MFASLKDIIELYFGQAKKVYLTCINMVNLGKPCLFPAHRRW